MWSAHFRPRERPSCARDRGTRSWWTNRKFLCFFSTVHSDFLSARILQTTRKKNTLQYCLRGRGDTLRSSLIGASTSASSWSRRFLLFCGKFEDFPVPHSFRTAAPFYCSTFTVYWQVPIYPPGLLCGRDGVSSIAWPAARP